MSTLHVMGCISSLQSGCALWAAPSKLYGLPATRCPRLPSIVTRLRRTKLPLSSCSASSNRGVEQISLGKTDPELFSEIQTNGEALSKQGSLFSSHGWAAFRVDHEDLDTLKQFSHVQAETFHVPLEIFDDFFFSIFEGGVLSSLLHKIRRASPKRFVCRMAIPEEPQSEQNKAVGVVDAAAMDDQHILRCPPGVDEYLYIGGMPGDSNHSVEVSPNTPMDTVLGHTLNAQQNVYRVSRRGLIALGICAVTTVGGEGKFPKNIATANAEQQDKTSSNGDVISHLDSKSDSPLNGLFSIFDTNEKTKSGKLLPKGYLKSARQVVKSLRLSLKEESGKEVDVRRSADSAKEAIRDYLQNWKGQKFVESEDSYKALEDALKALGKFYAKQGPRAMLPSDVKSQILLKLEMADAAL